MIQPKKGSIKIITITGQLKQSVKINIQKILITINCFDCSKLNSEILLNNDENWIFENVSMVKDCAVFGVVLLQCDQSGRDLKVLRPMNQQRGEWNIYPYKQKEDVKIFNRLK